MLTNHPANGFAQRTMCSFRELSQTRLPHGWHRGNAPGRIVQVLAGCVLLTAATARAQVCEPSSDRSTCVPLACSAIPEDQCIATVLHLDMTTGAITASECDCMDFNLCHVEFGNASPHTSGGCPDGGTCTIVAIDTNNDGFDDTFTAECVPNPPGVCCLDIDDGPVPYDTCVTMSENQGGDTCSPSSATCEEVQACCLAWSGAGLCADLHPFCCMLSGGVPQAPGSDCASITNAGGCGEQCGGFTGIQCEDPNDFCRLPEGRCCCDIMGVCATIPATGCPDNYDPVCGCDGITYGNDCEAYAAGMSIDHRGPCERMCGGLGPAPPCDEGWFCKFPEGLCGDGIFQGMCMQIPDSGCPENYSRVCGCDGVTYGNECEADAGGTSIAHRGECEWTCCDPDTAPPCIEGTFCHPNGGWFCGDGGSPPGCDILGTECGPVCGGPRSLACYKDGTFCKFRRGTCGQMDVFGMCLSRSGGWCVQTLWDPVCGCDNVTYGNPSEADAAGVSVRHEGECRFSACCFPDGTCLELPVEVCLVEGGSPLPGAQCDVVYCGIIPTGACCRNDPKGIVRCFVGTEAHCHAEGGAYQGDDSTCPTDASVPCGPAIGACCMGNATGVVPCFLATEAGCREKNGAYQGNDTTCPDDLTLPCGGLCDLLCPNGGECFSGCGTLVQAGGCVLFSADSGGVFSLNNLGGFHAGDRVFVSGCFANGCSDLCLSGSACIAVNTIDACNPVEYRLNPGSTFQSGCFDPCMCPMLEEAPLVGGFNLTKAGSDMWFEHFAVTDVEWLVPGSSATDPTHRIVGSGRYRIGGDFALAHQLSLDLMVDDEPVQHFDSGLIVGGAEFPDIRITVSMNDMWCYDVVLRINASPTGACCVTDAAGIPACIITTQTHCSAEGGAYQGDGSDCPTTDSTVPCGPPTGACCATDPTTALAACSITTEAQCIEQAGDYLGHGTACPDDSDLPCGGLCDPRCPPDQRCFSGCGTLVQGVECVLFQADSGGTFILTNLGDHAVGDRVQVTGCMDPGCVSSCVQGNGCIANNTIEPCGQVCGGIAGIPCEANNTFCKLPVGGCCCDFAGVCAPIPSGCPRVFDPVCGCDGETYSNECEADAAGMSIDHRGECEPPPCVATRTLSDPDLSYCGGQIKTVRIALAPPSGVTALGLADQPPTGWIVSNISHGGSFDAANGKVKWNPFYTSDIPSGVSYDVTPPTASAGQACFTGEVSLDGINEPICGDDCVDGCCPLMTADVPRPQCTMCPVGDCTTCNNSTCSDGQISLCELIGYACAWLRGCNDDLAGVTRAAYIWRHGECYCWDDSDQSWFATDCSTSDSTCCSSTAPGALAGGEVTAVFSMTNGKPTKTRSLRSVGVVKGDELIVPVTIQAPEGSTAVALEMNVPIGWRVIDISDDGRWDADNRKVKWGPYTEQLSRTVTFTADRPPVRTGTGATRSGDRANLSEFSGTVSFDGVNQPIGIEVRNR